MNPNTKKITDGKGILMKVVYGIYLLTGLVVAFVQIYNLMVKSKTPSV
jgi:hypothetical protein